ncbi:putative Zn-dependent protease [Elusimicrobium posterum]|uniref:metallopeptidase TldD-related protein n=1 Tax=Elusimicrobium posterum TaxID=3116653 RepID=UPI003C7793E7
MKKLSLLFVFSFISSALFAAYDPMIEKAMRDEMQRSKTRLQMDGLKKPYFVSYSLEPMQNTEITASLGALVRSDNAAYNRTKVITRVGTETFDNTNFEKDYPANTWSGGTGYNTVRHSLWLLTDSSYKKALEQLSKKQAFVKQKNITEVLPDFSKVKITQIKDPDSVDVFDRKYFEELAKEMSAQGKNHKVLKGFFVDIYHDNTSSYYLNSEGSFYYYNPVSIRITAKASLQTKEGFPIELSFSVNRASIKDLPSKEELIAQAGELAAKAASFENAKKASAFIGPVLFTGGATTTFLRNTFLKELENTRPYWGYQKDNTASPLSNSVGLRVAARGVNITDDPTLEEYAGVKLPGHYKMDEEGAPAQRVELVKKGKLENLLTTRSLLTNQKVSNGHARSFSNWQYPRAKLSNLFILPEHTMPAKNMKEKLREECAALELEYCYVFDAGYSVATKLYTKTGKEEPVYGVTFENVGTRPMRDILHAGDDFEIYPYNGWVPQTVITPSLIVAEIEIKETQEKPERKPPVSKPSF